MAEIEIDGKRYQSRHVEPNVELVYPRIDGKAKAIIIGLCDVRAADGIRVSYDFDRDGWKIEQASIFEWDCNDEECDRGYVEVAFVKAWASQRIPTPESEG